VVEDDEDEDSTLSYFAKLAEDWYIMGGRFLPLFYGIVTLVFSVRINFLLIYWDDFS
jgi:hypothetical protein